MHINHIVVKDDNLGLTCTYMIIIGKIVTIGHI